MPRIRLNDREQAFFSQFDHLYYADRQRLDDLLRSWFDGSFSSYALSLISSASESFHVEETPLILESPWNSKEELARRIDEAIRILVEEDPHLRIAIGIFLPSHHQLKGDSER
jgi:hypothetical protein